MLNCEGAKEDILRKYPIYHLSFKTRHLLTSTFVRFQEFYESPKFAGKIFTLEEFMDWYAREKGNFTYFTDWSGFNIPSDNLRPFYRGRFDPLSIKEKQLLKLFRRIRPPFYVIATHSPDSILHEIVHGLYFVDGAYRQKVKKALSQLNLGRLRRLLGSLSGYGYNKKVVDDEINAFLLTGLTKKMERLNLKRAIKTLKGVFKEHFGLDIDKENDQKKLIKRIHKQRFRV